MRFKRELENLKKDWRLENEHTLIKSLDLAIKRLKIYHNYTKLEDYLALTIKLDSRYELWFS